MVRPRWLLASRSILMSTAVTRGRRGIQLWGALKEEPETSRGRRRAMDSEHTTDRRVKFDFEVDFSNGGGLQGQGFRLDIEGEDISDEELARYVVEDMRLLMVEEVRILNKEIIAEEHKRVEPSF